MLKVDQIQKAKLSRRQSIQVGAATTAAGLLTSKDFMSSAQAKNDGQSAAPYTTPFAVALPVYKAKLPVSALSPPATKDLGLGECGRNQHQRWGDWKPQKFYSLNVRQALHSFHPELPTQTIWGYDGMLPGPTFVERYGQAVIVRIINNLPSNTIGHGSPEISTHLHNLHAASESDGYAGDYYSATKFGPTLSASGAYKDHLYPNCYAGYDDPQHQATEGDPREALGTLWYHDHRTDFTAGNVYRGLAGFYLLFDDIDSGNELDTNPKALRLPSGVGKYDIPLSIDDKQFDSGGYLAFDQFATKGILGNKVCVNGKIQPYFQVERRKYRLRLLNSSVSRFYELYITNTSGVNQSCAYIANDGNLLPAPLTVSKVHIAPAERGDIVLDFAKYPPYSKLYLVNRLVQTDGRGPEGPLDNPRGLDGLLTNAGIQIMRFDIGGDPATPDMSQVPARLRDLPPINLAEVVKTRRFEFDKENEVWTINSKIFDLTKPTVSPKRGTAEIWILKGKGSWHHPVHIHLEEGRILTRNGMLPPPHERGRKDVYVLEPNEEVRVFMRFRDFLGKYTMHCHNLVHEDHAMMLRFDVVE